MEDQKSLEPTACIGNTTESVQNWVDDFLADGVMSTSIIVSGIFFSGDELLRVEELFIGAGANFV